MITVYELPDGQLTFLWSSGAKIIAHIDSNGRWLEA